MECEDKYRDFSEFCQQLCDIKQKFHRWDSCEQTVALYYLMVGLPFGNAKFLQHALEQCIVAMDSLQTQILEQNANDAKVILNFLLEEPHVILSLLLSHLPLLKPDNQEAAKCYLKVIRQILLQSVTPPLKIYNECVEIMSYVYIHPAFSNEEKTSFKHLLKQVVNKVSQDNFIHSFTVESKDEPMSVSPDCKENVKRFNRRSNSLTPEDIASPKPPSKPRSFSLCSDNLLNGGICNLHETQSEIKLQDLILTNNLPAMKSIVSWLKSLRLHKYSWIFNNLTYDHMINLTDETLQVIGITKGARHKLLLSIGKLKERSNMLSELELGIMNGGDISNALKKMKSILQTPLEMSMDNEDLASQFVKVMGKVCTQLLMFRQPSEEYVILFSSLCDRAESMECFTDDQKRRLKVWNSQLHEEEIMPGFNHNLNYSKKPLCVYNDNKLIASGAGTSIHSPTYTKKSSSFPNMKSNTQATIKSHRHSLGSVALQHQLLSIPQNHFLLQKSDTQGPHSSNQDYYEIPPNKHNASFEDLQAGGNCGNNMDIESSLESLCIQMMEHALGP